MKKYKWILISVIIFEVIIIGIDVFFINKYISLGNNYFITDKIETEKNSKNINVQIEKILSLLEGNQINTQRSISKLNSQLTAAIEALTSKTHEQNQELTNSIQRAGISNFEEITEIKLSLKKYTQQINNIQKVNKLFTDIKTAESDSLIQQLLSEGLTKYNNGEFTEAVSIYRKILDVDSSNTEALSYFNASLYYQNPGDGSNFSGIKNNLILLLEGNTLSYDEERTVLNVLIGMSMEEGDSASLEKYQNTLQKLKDNRK